MRKKIKYGQSPGTVQYNNDHKGKKYRGVYSGVVTRTDDLYRDGHLQVNIRELSGIGYGTDQANTAGTIFSCRYMSPFAGQTGAMEDLGDSNTPDHTNTSTSYGFWAIPPDVGNIVLVMFINGNLSSPVWIGCLHQEYQNHAVPGMAATPNYIHEPGFTNEVGLPMPTTEYHKFKGTSSPDSENKPVHRYFARTLHRLGLLRDTLRGVTSSSARRETTSRVFGMSTPGPKISGIVSPSRKGGHQFVMDDGDEKGNNELIRLRTRNGAQILLHDSKGVVYIGNSSGTGWIEIGPAGNIDIWAEGSLSIRAEQDINLRADRDINLHAKRNLNTYVEGNVKTEITGSYDTTIGKTFKRNVKGVTNSLSGGNYISKAPNIHFNGPTPATAVIPEKIEKIQIDKSEAEMEKPGSGQSKVKSVVTRYPTREPYPEHVQGEKIEYEAAMELGEGSYPPGIVDGSSSVNADRPDSSNTPAGRLTGRLYSETGGLAKWTKSGASPPMSSSTTHSLNDTGLNIIAQFEAFRARMYRDMAQNPTIGFGHLLTKAERDSGYIIINGEQVNWKADISKDVATELLRQDAMIAENAIKSTVSVPLTQDQYNALTSWAFNVGTANVKSSTLIKVLNKGEYGKVPSELMRWVYAGRVFSTGLANRRKAEADIFTTLRTT